MQSKYVILALLLIVSVGCASTPYVSSPASATTYYTDYADHTGHDVDVHIFYEELAPHGTWVWLDGYGRVWYPHGVPPDWRPYTDGRWVYTDVGWTWISDWEWGWAPFHYGRWLHTPAHGWVWIPGTVWAPAWVVWHHGPGWVGWAPLPPAAVWEPEGRLHTVHVERHLHPSWFCFVREHHMLAPHVRRHIVSSTENARLVHSTRNVTHYTRRNKRVVNQSLQAERFEQATKQRVPRWRIVETDSPKALRQGQVQEKEGQVKLFRPPMVKATPDTETPRSAPRPHPDVAPLRRPQGLPPTPEKVPAAPPAVLGKEPPARPEPAPMVEPPKLPSASQEERRYQRRHPPAVLQKQIPPTPSQEQSPPAAESPAPAQKSRRLQQPTQESPGTERQSTPASRWRTAPPPPMRQSVIPNQPPRQEPLPSGQSQSPQTRREWRGRKPPAGQQEQEEAERGTLPPQSTGTISPSTGSGAQRLPHSGSPGLPSEHPSRRPMGWRSR
jgi:hypothetical protein